MKNLVGISYRRTTFEDEVIGKKEPDSPSVKLAPNEAGLRFVGDLAYIFTTRSLQRHPFPVFGTEKNVPELYIWNRIADEGDIYYFPNKSIYRCEYQPDGHSANFKRILRKTLRGFGLFYRDQLRRLKLGVPWMKALIQYLQCKFYELTTR